MTISNNSTAAYIIVTITTNDCNNEFLVGLMIEIFICISMANTMIHMTLEIFAEFVALCAMCRISSNAIATLFIIDTNGIIDVTQCNIAAPQAILSIFCIIAAEIRLFLALCAIPYIFHIVHRVIHQEFD